MKLTELIHAGAIIPELSGTNRLEVIQELMQSLANQGAIKEEDIAVVTKAAISREKQGSTGFGKGVAVPHVKHAKITKMIATIGRSSAGVDFNSLDRAPVYTIVLLLSPANENDQHLAAMEKIFRHLQRETFRRFLRQADSAEAMVELLQEADELRDE